MITSIVLTKFSIWALLLLNIVCFWILDFFTFFRIVDSVTEWCVMVFWFCYLNISAKFIFSVFKQIEICAWGNIFTSSFKLVDHAVIKFIEFGVLSWTREFQNSTTAKVFSFHIWQSLSLFSSIEKEFRVNEIGNLGK